MIDKVMLDSSLEELENNYWIEPKTYPTNLVQKVFQLRKKRLADYDIDDIRLMIEQNEGLSYLVPMALELLEKDVLAEGLYYPGDLLMSVLSIKGNYWEENKGESHYFLVLLKDSIKTIEESPEMEDNKELSDEILYKIGVFLSSNEV